MTIPVFPEFRDIDLSMQSNVNSILSAHPVEASEYTYTNMFAFRKTYNLKLSLLRDNLIILNDRDPASILCPVGGNEIPETLEQVFEFLKQYSTAPFMERVPGPFINTFLDGSNKYSVEESREHFDYVYDVKTLTGLKGRNFHDKKNKVNKFRNEYTYEYLTLTPGLVSECIEFEDYWCEVKDCEKYYGLKRERCAILAMLENFEELNLTGGVIKTDGKITALTIGEKYLQDTMLIHIEKANVEIPGLYQVINQEFLMHEADDCTYVNREQDLGIEGLRRSKMSYHPVRFNKKFRVTQK
jgi:hypothetical protein